MGALPLSFQKRLRGRRPLDFENLAIGYDHAPDDDPCQLLPLFGRSRGDRVAQRQDARSMSVEGDNPVAVG